ncbi:MAG: cytochrome c biogenesis protein CcsA [Deltaproteobacteria bacterium]|nr:cytochrome c biogenesis protein CcsA [Deltaproteobacteria bacterium]
MSGHGVHKEHIVGGIGLALFLYGSWLGLFVAPPEKFMGDVGRIFYIHVPTATIGLLVPAAACLIAVGSLVRDSARWDAALEGTIEVSTLLIAMMLLQGSIWAKPTWGVYWDWDPRLTTSSILMASFVGVLALRSFVEDPLRRASWSAVATIVAFANVPIVYFSVKWWRTLHQGFTGRRNLEDTMGEAFAFNWWGLLLMVTWLVVRRSRLAWLTRPRAVAAEEAPAASSLVAGG